MKQLLLLAIVGIGLIGATTAFATNLNTIALSVVPLGASDDKAITTDITAASVSFSVCQNYDLAPVNPNGPTDCKTANGGTGPVLVPGPYFNQYYLLVTDCDIHDTTDTNVPVGEQIICKLTDSAGKVVGEGMYTTTANDPTDCTVAGCNWNVLISPVTNLDDIQNVHDVKVIAKGTVPVNTPIATGP